MKASQLSSYRFGAGSIPCSIRIFLIRKELSMKKSWLKSYYLKLSQTQNSSEKEDRLKVLKKYFLLSLRSSEGTVAIAALMILRSLCNLNII